MNKSFDIVKKQINSNNNAFTLYLIDGFAKDMIMMQVITRLQLLNDKETISDLDKIIKNNLSYIETSFTDDINLAIQMFLSGAIILIGKNTTGYLIIDAREYPVRGINEPELEKVTRGPKDGFTETIIFNTALIRRRIRDKDLNFELMTIGNKSGTNIAIGYLDDTVNKETLAIIKDKLNNINVDNLFAGEKTLIELLMPQQLLNPLPKVRYTERPDVASNHLLEGHIIIVVDNTPSVIMFPTTIFHFFEHPEDYYSNIVIGTYLRYVRFIAILVTLLAMPVYMFNSSTPNLWQFLIIEVGIDMLRISSMNTPSNLNTIFSLIAGIVVSEIAVQSGVIDSSIVLIGALTGFTNFLIPSIEFSYAIKIFRIFLLLLTYLFSIPGFIIGIVIILITIYFTDNGTNISYTYPLIPLDIKKLKSIFIRKPAKNIK